MSIFNFQNVSTIPFRAKDTTVVINRLVKLDTVLGQVVGATANSDLLFGIAAGMVISPSAAQDQVGVQTDGVALVEAGAAVAIGDYITSDGSSRGITASAGQRAIGRAIEAAGGAGELIGVKLFTGALKMP